MTTEGVRIGAVLVAAVLLVAAGGGVAVAQEDVESGEDELVEVSGWTAVAVLLAGTILLMASIELLIHALVRTAVRFGISAFLLAVVFSGWEFDNVAFGIFTGFREMQNVAFGLAIGNAVSIFGLTLALGALLFPFVIDVPNDYLAMMAAAPLVLIPVIVSGTLTPALSMMFIMMYVVIFAYVLQRERQIDRTFMQSEEVKRAVTVPDGQRDVAGDLPSPLRRFARKKWFWPSMLLVSVLGIVIGAEGAAIGVEGILETWHLTGTFVGVTLITILFTIDDILLIVEPLRLGYPDVAVGGVIGSLLFFVTANVGIVGLLGEIQFRSETVFFHLPVLLGFTGLASYLLWRGKLTRKHGVLLLGLYVLYLLVNVRFFATVPLGE
ncbi:sodium:calcium antiporter [Saliphagus sp. GCM10025317]